MIQWIKTKDELPKTERLVIGYYETPSKYGVGEEVHIVVYLKDDESGEAWWETNTSRNFAIGDYDEDRMVDTPDYWMSIKEPNVNPDTRKSILVSRFELMDID